MAFAVHDGKDDNGTISAATAIVKRGAGRLIGTALLVFSVITGLMLWSFTPSDPSPMNVSDTMPQNWLGYTGAFFAGPLMQLVGIASWVIPFSAFIWGLRLVRSWGAERAISRAIFLPIALIVAAIFTSSIVPYQSWAIEPGMGGVVGDALLSMFIGLMPFGPEIALFFMTILFGALSLSLFAFVTGATVPEMTFWVSKIVNDTKMAVIVTAATIITGFAKVTGKSRDVGLALKARREAKEEAAVQPATDTVLGRKSEKTGPLNLKSLQIFGGNDIESSPSSPVFEDNNEPESETPKASRIAEIVARKASRHKQLLGGRADVEDEVLEAAEDAPQTAHKERIVSEPAKATVQSKRAETESQPGLSFDDIENYEKPPLALLQSPDTIDRVIPSRESLNENARLLEAVLDDYGVKGEITAVKPGPVVTMYELEPAAGLKASRVIGLADDIARSMSALTARVSTVPGRSVIGIELPNDSRETVLLREIFASKTYGDTRLPLPLALGKDISGDPTVANLAKMPHLLIAGTTGSGKSVAINTMILSLLYHLDPDQCRLIMIDPKMLELSVYDGIPHLLSPVVTDPKKAVVALKWVVSEMEDRYRKMSKMGVRNIDGYNARVSDAIDKGEGFQRTVQTGFDDDTGEPIFETEEFTPEKMPYIVVIVDEMADLMMVAGKEIEACIQRLAQMARASGIHLIMATQRPSVDVITGTIKANFPTRISFQVTSKIDSRTILGEMGAEQLLGMGDMLYMAGGGRIQRVHAPFVSDEEVEDVVRHLKAQGEPQYVSGVQEGPADEKAQDIDAVLGLSSGNGDAEDQLYDQAVMIVARDRKCSTSYIQRKLAIGYNKAARLVERMEDEGVVSAANQVGKRDILVPEVE